MTTFNMLKTFENSAIVEDVLCAYFNVKPENLMHSLTEEFTDTIEYWADCCKVSMTELLCWIEGSLRFPARFSIVNKCGCNGWPECELDLDGGIVLNFDWVIDD